MAVAAVCIGGACSRDDSTRKAMASVLPLCSSIIDAAVVYSDDTGYKGGRLWPRPLQRGDLLRLMPPTRGWSAVAKAHCKGATGYGQGPMHRGRLALASLQGRQAPTGMAACDVAPVGRPAVERRPR
ncbi:hypothetical protein B296_00020514 [Ensete ventricosum]|uniref:Uncharacterized protein n=1 Tax=Ensete ventricosum TaxID=4639 RepID=A0A427AVZ7_ENSVE|nr:hypothetical protein B296_00020514 [Ensete ventricosum]